MDQIHFIFEIAPKMCQGGRCLHCQRSQIVFEEDEAERPLKKNFNFKNLKNQKKSKNNNKKSDKFFYFSKLPPKWCPGVRRLHPPNTGIERQH